MGEYISGLDVRKVKNDFLKDHIFLLEYSVTRKMSRFAL